MPLQVSQLLKKCPFSVGLFTSEFKQSYVQHTKLHLLIYFLAFISCLLYFEVLCFQVSTERENAVISFWWIILVWSSLGVLVFLWTMHILPLRKHKRKQNLPYFWLSDFLGLQESSKQFLSMYQSAPYYF